METALFQLAKSGPAAMTELAEQLELPSELLGGAAGLTTASLAIRTVGLLAICAAGAVGARSLRGAPATATSVARRPEQALRPTAA